MGIRFQQESNHNRKWLCGFKVASGCLSDRSSNTNPSDERRTSETVRLLFHELTDSNWFHAAGELLSDIFYQENQTWGCDLLLLQSCSLSLLNRSQCCRVWREALLQQFIKQTPDPHYCSVESQVVMILFWKYQSKASCVWCFIWSVSFGFTV